MPIVNQTKASAKSSKSTKLEIERLIDLLLQRGADRKVSGVMAPIIGLEKPTNVKQQDVIVKQDDTSGDMRTCFVVFSDDEQKRPMCLFVKRTRQTLSTAESKYFRVDLTGKLENVIVWAGKRTEAGGIRGSGVKTEQDIQSPEVKKEFNAEMAYWLKDWLKKESKKAPSKSASVAPAAKPATVAL